MTDTTQAAQSADRSLLLRIAVIGGTGKEGAGLALRWAAAGYPVIIGSRDGERAAQKAAELTETLRTQIGESSITGLTNEEAARAADVIVLSVPYDGHAATCEALRAAAQGKIVVDVTVPTMPPDIRTVHVPEGKAACLESAAIFGPEVRVVAAFQNVSAVHLANLAHTLDCDVLVCGDDAAAKEQVIALTSAAGLRGVDAGPLANAVAAEALTPVLLYINRKYKVKGAGVRITGLSSDGQH